MPAMVTPELIRTLFEYNPETGALTRKVTKSSRAVKGMVAGGGRQSGDYLKVHVNQREYKVHRLIWLYVHGRWPDYDLDHINGVKTDNRLANLREATRSENMRNTRLRPDNMAGIRGVRFHKMAGKYCARIRVLGKEIHLGLFLTPEEASAAYKAAVQEYFGEFTPR